MAKTLLVTGASSGIGKAVAQKFLSDGWNVALVARRLDKLQTVAGDYKSALAISCDVTDEGSVQSAFDQCIDHFGGLDVLFNNAGVFVPQARIDKMPLSDWQMSVDVNLTGMFLCARAAFAAMVKTGGRIINNGSISATTPREGSVGYTATKHAITGLTKTISLDGRDLNICCGQIDIGNARTEMIDNLIKASGKEMPTMEVAEVANAVWNMANLPLNTNVLRMTIMANQMPFVGRG